MTFRKSLVLICAGLLLNACSNDGGGNGGGGRNIDINQFNVEAISAETALTDSDFSARLNAMKRIPRACRQSSTTLRKGDRFVEEARASFMKNGTIQGMAGVANATIFSVGDREFSKVITVENMKALGLSQDQILRDNKAKSRCVKRGTNYSCRAEYKYTSASVESQIKQFERDINANFQCQKTNSRQFTAKYSAATYTMQDGRSVPVLIQKSQALYDLACPGTAVKPVIYSLVQVYSDQVKDSQGQDCATGVTMLFNYYALQTEARELMAEAGTRILLAPVR